jgi:hypothetical protein
VKPATRVRVSMVMRSFVLVALIACGGKTPPSTEPTGSADDPPGVVADTRTELEKRRDAGCEQLKPKIVNCAVDDARANFEAGKVSKEQYQKDTAPEVQKGLADKWMKDCRVEMSSRQVRVLEVCFREEQECGPLVSCLEHLNPKK